MALMIKIPAKSQYMVLKVWTIIINQFMVILLDIQQKGCIIIHAKNISCQIVVPTYTMKKSIKSTPSFVKTFWCHVPTSLKKIQKSARIACGFLLGIQHRSNHPEFTSLFQLIKSEHRYTKATVSGFIVLCKRNFEKSCDGSIEILPENLDAYMQYE